MSDTKPETTSGPAKRPEGWERGVLERLALATLDEQRRARRWGIFFKLFFAAYLVVVLVMLVGDQRAGKSLASRYTALVELDGAIAPDSQASADNVITGLRAAFEAKNTVGIVLRANSPGGSPVQAGYIYDEILRLREKHPKIPLYAVIGDVCASGCYYAVAAADKIYADKASIVGSIGVLMNGFGFTDTMKKLGVERRLPDRRRTQGLSRSLQQHEARGSGARTETPEPHSPAVHRARTRGTRRGAQGNQGHVLRPVLDR